MNRPSAASTAAPARDKAEATIAAAAASAGPFCQLVTAAPSTTRAPATATTYPPAGAQASGQATASRPNAAVTPLAR
jgi:hypothetical protein